MQGSKSKYTRYGERVGRRRGAPPADNPSRRQRPRQVGLRFADFHHVDVPAQMRVCATPESIPTFKWGAGLLARLRSVAGPLLPPRVATGRPVFIFGEREQWGEGFWSPLFSSSVCGVPCALPVDCACVPELPVPCCDVRGVRSTCTAG